MKAFYDKRGIDRAPVGPSLQAFTDNLGPLREFVEPHEGKIEDICWTGDDVGLLICDAPKRVPVISAVLSEFRLKPGAIMAWQDFCHFPSYEIPACLYRIRDNLEFVEAVVPGTTLVFRVKSQWELGEVSPDALAIERWALDDIDDAWIYWASHVPREKESLFRCGKAMFLCDLGYAMQAVAALADIYYDDAEAILPKWRYLKANRPDFLTRYAPLFAYLEAHNAV